MMRIGLIIWLSLFLLSAIAGQSTPKERWVDSLMAQLSLEEKIGQTIMVRAHSNLGADHVRSVKQMIQEYHIGALCFFQGNPVSQARLTHSYQKLAKIPLLVAMDAEWGTGMRFKEDGFSFPRQLTIGAATDVSLTQAMGYEIGTHLRQIGVHLNFAPVVDVNNNPKNPVINDRSFGENPEKVIQHSIAYMKGLHQAKIASCAKHFPGHGDTEVDSHHDLPVILHDRARLEAVELRPFNALIQAGVPSIMVAHLHIPTLDNKPNIPTTLSYNTVTNVLRKEMGFDGVIVTDAMEMKGVTKHFEEGEAEVLALLAGNDILCLPANVPKAIAAITEAIQNGRLTEKELDTKVARILSLKYELGLSNLDTLSYEERARSINYAQAEAIKASQYEKSITCVKNKKKLIPFRQLGNGLIGSISIGARDPTAFQNQLQFYHRIVDIQVDPYFKRRSGKRLLEEMEVMDVVVVGIHNMNKHARKNYGINPLMMKFLRELDQRTQVILVLFGSPYATSLFENFDHVMVAYDESEMAQRTAAQMLFGAKPIEGQMPVSTGSIVKGTSFYVPPMGRLGVSLPEQVGLNRDTLALIDTIAKELIAKKASPGCQILVAKDGQIVYHKAFGHHTYEQKSPVLETDVYDLASVTKVAATTLAVMKLYDEGRIDLDGRLGDYLPEATKSNKGQLKIRDILSHRAGLKAWIPFYKNTIIPEGNGSVRWNASVYDSKANNKYTVPVARGLFMNRTYIDTIFQAILDSDLSRNGKYVYSDLGLILMARVVEEIDGRSLDKFVMEEFFRPMGLLRTSFSPLRHQISSASIPPTEEDDYFRLQRLQGHVHDMGAAMMGGVSGHAGLFSNTQELAAIFQMLLNGGHYGGVKYLKESTVKEFTKRVPGASRRGLGFDMKQLDRKKRLNMAEEASGATFGHLGFTGIAAWADPIHNIITIFLSNRTYPKMDNPILSRNNYRPKIQAVPYRALQKHQKHS